MLLQPSIFTFNCSKSWAVENTEFTQFKLNLGTNHEFITSPILS